MSYRPKMTIDSIAGCFVVLARPLFSQSLWRCQDADASAWHDGMVMVCSMILLHYELLFFSPKTKVMMMVRDGRRSVGFKVY